MRGCVGASRRLILASVFAGGAAALAFGPACEVFTRETCNAGDLVALGDTRSAVCKECLERAATCDTVGRCNDVAGCTLGVHEAHACVLDAGKRAFEKERTCLGGLNETATTTYSKMRESCGSECALPVCKVTTSTIQFGDSTCDRCITGACCEEINRCYENRTCKLILECIVRECGKPLGPDTVPSQLDPCTGLAAGGPPPAFDAGDVDGGDGGTRTDCLRTCLTRYADHEPRPPGDIQPKDSAQCLAYTVRTCAFATGCGAQCDSLR